MKTAILYVSVHHGNTKKVVQAMASAVPADVFDLQASPTIDLSQYERIGLASGCFYHGMHETIKQFVAKRDFPVKQKIFLVCTCGIPYRDYTAGIKKQLSQKDVEIIGTFQCRGFDTFGFFGKIGGIAKQHPNEKDLQNAAAFMQKLQ